MYIQPNSRVYLLANVPLNKKYIHTVRYSSANDQLSDFLNYRVKTATALQYVRKTRSLKLNYSADDIYMCNYMVFQNTPFGDKWYYAFIDSIEYVSNEVCEIFFTIDVMQTYWFDFTFRDCYVAREHTATDGYGEHLVPEPIKSGEYVYTQANSSVFPFSPSNYYLIVGTTEYQLDPTANPEDESTWITADNQITTNIFSALKFGRADNAETVAAYIERYTKCTKEKAIKVIYVCPHPDLCDGLGTINYYFDDDNVYPAKNGGVGDNILDTTITRPTTIDGYTPKNKKLLTSQFVSVVITDGNGQISELSPEYFTSNNMIFRVLMSHSATPELICFPINYVTQDPKKNMIYGVVNSGVSMGCASVSNFDSWWAYNSTKSIVKGVTSGISAVGSISSGNVGGALSSLSSIVNLVNEAQIAYKEPNKLLTTANGGSEITGCVYGFNVLFKSVHREMAKVYDDFMTMFGYQVNTIKKPGFDNRPVYNYVKTNGCNIVGKNGLPSDANESICSIMDNGITFWNSLANVGNYSLNNSPVSSQNLEDGGE